MIKVSSDQDIAPDVTIGIPVYRPNLHSLATCLDSIYSQTEYDGIVEVLLVVDGEKENRDLLTSKVLEERPWVAVFVQEHGGVCVARNTVLQRARGSWLVFVDADDRLDENGISVLIGAGESYGADIVASNHWRARPNRVEEVSYIKTCSVLHNGECLSFVNTVLSCGSDQGTVWAKALRLSFIRDNNLLFKSDLINGEDQEFMVRSVLAARTIVAVPELTYSYIFNPASIVRSFNDQYPKILDYTIRCIRDDLSAAFCDPQVLQSYFEYCLDRFLMLSINYIGHPDFPGGYRARKAAFRQACNSSSYAPALKQKSLKAFSLGRRIVLICAKARVFFPVWLISLFRHRQLQAG